MKRVLRPRTILISVALLAVLAPAAMVGAHVVHEGAFDRCGRHMPDDAWGYSMEWDRSERAFICIYSGRDYRSTGDTKRIGLTELF